MVNVNQWKLMLGERKEGSWLDEALTDSTPPTRLLELRLHSLNATQQP
jgi:hypothetical protein